MPIKRVAVLLALAACPSRPELTPDAGPGPTAEQGQITQESAVCDVQKYRCNPLDPGAQNVCDIACRLPAYCMDYYPSDYIYCWDHPDHFDRYYRYCNLYGMPTWDTYCVDGYQP